MNRTQHAAIAYQLLYLVNLLALPLLSILILWLAYTTVFRKQRNEFNRHHYRIALWGSSIGLLLIGLPALAFYQAGYNSAEAWTTLILYLIVTHTTLVMFGIFTLAKAIAGKQLRESLSQQNYS